MDGQPDPKLARQKDKAPPQTPTQTITLGYADSQLH